mmetsp:Transcript_5202/g.15780  ORF Transcript_5202/g.15780 Transcript_5202/m.15780 type:complete len:272 (-) Transcript_5202:1106-1921(-)
MAAAIKCARPYVFFVRVAKVRLVRDGVPEGRTRERRHSAGRIAAPVQVGCRAPVADIPPGVLHERERDARHSPLAGVQRRLRCHDVSLEELVLPVAVHAAAVAVILESGTTDAVATKLCTHLASHCGCDNHRVAAAHAEVGRTRHLTDDFLPAAPGGQVNERGVEARRHAQHMHQLVHHGRQQLVGRLQPRLQRRRAQVEHAHDGAAGVGVGHAWECVRRCGGLARRLLRHHVDVQVGQQARPARRADRAADGATCIAAAVVAATVGAHHV